MRLVQQTDVLCGRRLSGDRVCCDYSDDCTTPGGPKIFCLDGSIAFLKSGKANPAQPNPTQPLKSGGARQSSTPV